MAEDVFKEDHSVRIDREKPHMTQEDQLRGQQSREKERE